ncbi:MAG: PIN domain-containing protein [Leptospira sp.]|nr:PIN domain-containing protein [Leptospira sp.]
MKRYLLDTNVCIQYITGRSKKLRDKIKSMDLSSLYICSIVRGELEYGAQKSNNPEKSLKILNQFLDNFSFIDFDTDSSKSFGLIRANLEKKGTPIVVLMTYKLEQSLYPINSL